MQEARPVFSRKSSIYPDWQLLTIKSGQYEESFLTVSATPG
jgi:hypothetical protein